MVMMLPKGIPMLNHMVAKKLSRPDNIFCTNNLSNYVVRCDAMPEKQPGKTNHYPIATILELTQERVQPKSSRNFRETDWEEFNKTLENELANVMAPPKIKTTEELGKEI